MSLMLKRCLLALVMAALVAVTNAADTRDDIATPEDHQIVPQPTAGLSLTRIARLAHLAGE